MLKLKQIGEDLNAYVFSFGNELLEEVRTAFSSTLAGNLNKPQNAALLAGGKAYQIEINTSQHKYFLMSYGQSPLLWISNNCVDSYQMFKRFFDAVAIQDDLKQLVDFDQDIVMYSGFFVVGNHLKQPLWHVDYERGANAYTLITPLFDPDNTQGELLYQDKDKNTKDYRYKLNEAVIFGDQFLHTTQPYPKTDRLRVLLSLTFGTDKLEYWDILKATIGGQSQFMMLPCGHPAGTCNCLDNLARD